MRFDFMMNLNKELQEDREILLILKVDDEEN